MKGLTSATSWNEPLVVLKYLVKVSKLTRCSNKTRDILPDSILASPNPPRVLKQPLEFKYLTTKDVRDLACILCCTLRASSHI